MKEGNSAFVRSMQFLCVKRVNCWEMTRGQTKKCQFILLPNRLLRQIQSLCRVPSLNKVFSPSARRTAEGTVAPLLRMNAFVKILKN